MHLFTRETAMPDLFTSLTVDLSPLYRQICSVHVAFGPVGSCCQGHAARSRHRDVRCELPEAQSDGNDEHTRAEYGDHQYRQRGDANR